MLGSTDVKQGDANLGSTGLDVLAQSLDPRLMVVKYRATETEAIEAFNMNVAGFEPLARYLRDAQASWRYVQRDLRRYRKDPSAFDFEEIDYEHLVEEAGIEYADFQCDLPRARFGRDGEPHVVEKSAVLEQVRWDLTFTIEEEIHSLSKRGVSELPTQDEIFSEVHGLIAKWACLPTVEILEQLIFRAGRMSGPILLWDWWDKFHLINTTELRQLLLQVWSGADYPESLVSTERWLKMFNAAGYVSDGHPVPTQDLTVFRGAPEGYEQRMSWTTDIQIATNFGGLDGKVWTTTVPPEAILARIENVRPGESEVLVHPKYLIGSATPSIVPAEQCDLEVRSEERDEASPDPYSQTEATRQSLSDEIFIEWVTSHDPTGAHDQVEGKLGYPGSCILCWLGEETDKVTDKNGDPYTDDYLRDRYFALIDFWEVVHEYLDDSRTCAQHAPFTEKELRGIADRIILDDIWDRS